MFSNPTFIYGFVFLATLLLIDTLLRYLRSNRRRKTEARNRLDALREKHGEGDGAYKELLARRGFVQLGNEQSVGGWVNMMIGQAGLELNLTQRVIYVFVFFIVSLVFGTTFVTNNIYLAFVFGGFFAAAVAALIIRFLRDRRIKAFTRQLPQAIDIIVRSLKAGHPLTAAIKLCAREMPDPIGSEFGILTDQLTFGSALDQGMLNMIDRVGVAELNLMAVTVSVQKGTGGNLSEILENLSQMIRDRLMIKAKIKAISSEGRITGWIMFCFPFFLFFMIRALVPTYFDELWESGYGPIVVWSCLIMMFFGMMIIRKLVNFDF